MEWRMSERATAAPREVNRLFGDRTTAATTQTDSRTATTATPTPSTASTLPRWCRRTVTLLQVPRTRPPYPKPQAVSRTSDTTTMERVTSPCPLLNNGTHTRVPRRNPSRKPPNARIWTSAPSRRPWTAASSISPMINRSTQSTDARVANGALGNAAPTAIVVVPCFHAPCLDTGVSGDAAAAYPSSLLLSPSPRRAARCLDTRVRPRSCASSASPMAPRSRRASPPLPAPVSSEQCRVRRPGAVGPLGSSVPIRLRRLAPRSSPPPPTAACRGRRSTLPAGSPRS